MWITKTTAGARKPYHGFGVRGKRAWSWPIRNIRKSDDARRAPPATPQTADGIPDVQYVRHLPRVLLDALTRAVEECIFGRYCGSWTGQDSKYVQRGESLTCLRGFVPFILEWCDLQPLLIKAYVYFGQGT